MKIEKGGKRKKEGLERKIEELIGAQLKLVLVLLLIEVRGLVFNYNQLVVASSLIICISAYLYKVIIMILIDEIRAYVLMQYLGMRI